jgi:DNA-binding MarR family transcriptional regulator
MTRSTRRVGPRSGALYDGRRYDIADSVGYQIVCLMSLMRREVASRMAEHGLTDAQWRPLWLLKAGRAATAIELARELDVDAGAVTRLVDRLQAKGLLARVRSATDRRVVQLQLTADGEAAVKKVPFVLASVNNDFLRGFSEAEWLQLRRLLGRMAANGAALQRATEAG